MTEIIELRPNPNLMNRSFEKYQFVNDAIPIISEITLKKREFDIYNASMIYLTISTYNIIYKQYTYVNLYMILFLL